MPEFRAGYTLMWRVSPKSETDAETLARNMEDHAKIHRLGDCGITSIGIGPDCWFDVTLDQDVDAVFIVALFTRLPDEVY